MDVKALCVVVAKMVSETFGVPSVTIWLWDDKVQEQVVVGGSTIFSDTQRFPAKYMELDAVALGLYMREQSMPIDFDKTPDTKADELKSSSDDYFCHAQIRYGVPLAASHQILGFMTLSNSLTRESFSVEDRDLLKTVADQVAANLLNLRLSQRLLKAKEMEAFQMLSAFFVHDLKNLAAKLSLMVQNLPDHYNNPAFRDDMMRVISGSVSKMNAMCSRLSLLTQRLELQRTETDLNELVRLVLAELDGSINVSLHQNLTPTSKLFVDIEQLQKVLTNLLLNANEAVGEHGEVYVKTEQVGRWAVLSVKDNGCGMTQEFMTQSLFQPFQTTKSDGLGIGLFHTKMLVEAHQGRIEVESEKGVGTTFRVLLPSSPIIVGRISNLDNQTETVSI
jgi:putative PEP-CTERM system histidine kinase